MTTEEFIRRAKEVHGDKYDYSKVNYQRSNKKVIIICHEKDENGVEHGEFEQYPYHHLKGHGCSKCSVEKNSEKTKMSPQLFIKKSKEKYGDKYDYSKVEETWKGYRNKITLICHEKDENGNEHGEFEVIPNSHLSKQSQECPKCVKEKTNKELRKKFIEEATKIHKGKYTYDNFIWKGINRKGKITCPLHGDFPMTPQNHRGGKQGCPYCYGNVKLTTEEFIRRAKEIHGDKYDYSKVIYKGRKEKVCIICKEKDENGNIHGEFWQSPDSHLSGCGCPKCGKKEKLNTEEFIRRAKEVHGDKYDYSKVEYKNSHTKVTIICPIHREFEQIPINHLKGQGCPKCKGKNLDTEEFIRRAKEVHGDKYDYSKVIYKGISTPVTIICPIHGEFEQKPREHLNGCGCTKCNNGFSISQKNMLLTEYDLENMSSHQLLELISDNVFPKDFELLVNTELGSKERTDKIEELKKSYSSDEEDENKIKKDIDESNKEYIKKHSKTKVNDCDDDKEVDTLFSISNEIENYDKSYQYLKTLGDKEKLISTIEIQKIWNNVLSDIYYNNDGSFYSETYSYIKNVSPKSIWLKTVKGNFLNEFEIVNNLNEDNEYCFEYKPSLMQKLMMYKLKTNKRYLNLCGTGAGKTNSFLLSTRYLKTKNIVCITPNSVKRSIEDSINSVYPNSNIINYQDIDSLSNVKEGEYNYIIMNYEKFSNDDKIQKSIDKLINDIGVDFICIDEIHRAKYRNTEDISKTHYNIKLLCSKASEVNNNLYVLGMTATPIINNLLEVKSLLEIVIGKEFEEINSKNTIQNIHYAYKNLLLNGFRYVPDYNIKVNTKLLKCNGDELIDKLITINNKEISQIETILIDKKIDLVKDYIGPKTIIYTQYVTNIVNKLKKKINELGFTCKEYTGEINSEERDNIVYNEFKNGEIDVLIASSPISTGVDGLQKITNKLIIMSMPWTSAEYQQLIGRINRQGSEFKTVDLIIPQVDINLSDGSNWSWDRYRYNVVKSKKTLFDAVVDGVFADSLKLNRNEILKMAIDRLKNGIMDFKSTERNSIKAEYTIDLEGEDKKRNKYMESIVNNIHQKANVSKSNTMHSYFKKNPEDWKLYHQERDKNKKNWALDPIDFIAKMLNSRNYSNIADLGCGTNELKLKVNNYKKWYSFDHISIDDSVISADISDLGNYLENDSIDCSVFCLSLWGTNYMDYIKEAYRYTRKNGEIIICEPTDKINQKELISGAIKMNFNISNIKKESNFTFLTFIKM